MLVNVFTKGKWGNFDYKNFITGYLGIPIYIGSIPVSFYLIFSLIRLVGEY